MNEIHFATPLLNCERQKDVVLRSKMGRNAPSVLLAGVAKRIVLRFATPRSQLCFFRLPGLQSVALPYRREKTGEKKARSKKGLSRFKNIGGGMIAGSAKG